jgi:hypothetical protein
MGDRPPSRARKAAAILFFTAAGILLFRLLGPGGAPAERSVVPPPPPPPSSAPAPKPLSGRVVRADGTPAPGAVVEAVFETGGGAPPVTLASAPVGADGRFSIEGGPASWTSLKVRARRGPLAVEADLDGAPGPLDMELRLPTTFAVGGLVLAAEDGRPLPRMEVRLGDRTAVTDDFGRFQLGTLPAALLEREAPEIEVQGAGRKPVRRALPLDARADDLLLRVEKD